jgi:uncharacterized protein (DUF58 family)
MKHESIRLRPTGLWIIFGPILLCMLLAAINYSNNLVYAVLFLVASLSFVSVFHTWRNIASVRVEHVHINSAFAKEDVRVEIHLSTPADRPVFGLNFARIGEESGSSRRSVPLIAHDNRGFRVRAGDSLSVEVTFPSVRRGMYRFEALLVKSSYPFGLFSASFRVPVDATYFIYPVPKGNDTWPDLRPSGDSGSPFSRKPGDDFAGVRPYMPGESLRHVDWKAYARGRPLSVKQFTGGDGHELWLDAAEMLRLPIEERLSQLSLWIVNAEKTEIPYALKLGRTTLPLGLGAEQSRRALEVLAVAGIGSTERLS